MIATSAAVIGTAIALLAPGAQAASVNDELGVAIATGTVSTSIGAVDYEAACKDAFYVIPAGVGSPNPQFELAGAITETGTDVLAVRVGCKVFQDGAVIAQAWSSWADGAGAAGPVSFTERTLDPLTVCAYPYLIINAVVKPQTPQCSVV